MPKITFVNWGVTVEVEPGTTILEAAQSAEDRGVTMGSVCGGVAACSSCHCWVVKGGESLDDPSEREEDILDKAFDVRPNSRLGCQVEVADEDLVVEVTQESIRAWYDEHPDERRKAQEEGRL